MNTIYVILRHQELDELKNSFRTSKPTIPKLGEIKGAAREVVEHQREEEECTYLFEMESSYNGG
jgi:hypothetical protein